MSSLSLSQKLSQQRRWMNLFRNKISSKVSFFFSISKIAVTLNLIYIFFADIIRRNHLFLLIINSNVGTCTEVFLWTTSNSTAAVTAISPVVSGNICPLKNAMVASKTTRKSNLNIEPSWISMGQIKCIGSICQSQSGLIETTIGFTVSVPV